MSSRSHGLALLRGVLAAAVLLGTALPAAAAWADDENDSSARGGASGYSTQAYVSPGVLAPPPVRTVRPPAPTFSLFGSSEIRSTGLSSFPNWTTMLARFRQEERLGQGLCATAGSDGGSCAWDEWQALISRLRGASPTEQMHEVNRVMNKRRYRVDRSNWGMEDYWETVFEFMRRSGDCEDYAIAKYVTLRALGWPMQSLRVVILRDNKLRVNHAVLAIYTDQGIYIGDNQVSGLVPADRIRHYTPIYSLNEEGWWLHRPMARP